MSNYFAPLQKDAYKVFHKFAYNPLVTHVYSNFTNRFGKYSNVPENSEVLFVGLQYFIKEVLIDQWSKFFSMPKEMAVGEYSRVVDAMLGKHVDTSHIGALHSLGYLPIKIKALEEGTLVPYGIPCLTIENTVEGFGWVTNMLETVMSAELWGISTSATTAYAYRKRFEQCEHLDKNMIPFMGHDFSYRGMFGTQAAAMSGFGHLCSFVGSDTIPAALFAEKYYGARIDKELVFASVDATEHSVMCSYGTEGELESIKHLITNVTPTGIISLVSDTWDFWKLVTEYLPALKDVIMSREGTLVIRPDSGDPVDILCGDVTAKKGSPEYKGLIECLWDAFGGTITDKGLRLLDSHIGAIYGDSITLERQDQIINRLVTKGFVPSVVLGVGSFTYQYVTRDTHGSAVKATCTQHGKGNYHPIFKDPKTDAKKKSAKGLLKVVENYGRFELVSDISPVEEDSEDNLLKEVFVDGKLTRETTLSEIRDKIKKTF